MCHSIFHLKKRKKNCNIRRYNTNRKLPQGSFFILTPTILVFNAVTFPRDLLAKH
jgi:hypothetical protein